MKDRKIWGLVLILVIGMAVTLFTDRALKREQQAVFERVAIAAETREERSGVQRDAVTEIVERPVPTDGVPAPAALQARGFSDEVVENETEETANNVSENMAESAVAESGEVVAAMEVVEVPTWRNRLDEVEARIQTARASVESASTSNSLKSQATTELNLWETELNSLYSQILEKLDEEQAKKLAQQQREWMKIRDSKAMAAAQNSQGATESVEYISSLAQSAKERAYALLDLYEKELDL